VRTCADAADEFFVHVDFPIGHIRMEWRNRLGRQIEHVRFISAHNESILMAEEQILFQVSQPLRKRRFVPFVPFSELFRCAQESGLYRIH
jgi:hypothetical protein